MLEKWGKWIHFQTSSVLSAISAVLTFAIVKTLTKGVEAPGSPLSDHHPPGSFCERHTY